MTVIGRLPDKAGRSRAPMSVGRTTTVDDERSGAMHGRDEVLARAQRPLDEAVAGRGGLVLLAGEAGIGKTRLLRAVQDVAAERGLALWSAAASPQDVELSGGLLLDLGHAMARSGRPDVADRGRALLTDLLDVTGQSPPPVTRTGGAGSWCWTRWRGWRRWPRRDRPCWRSRTCTGATS